LEVSLKGNIMEFSKTLTKEEANRLLASKVKEFKLALSEAEDIADAYGLYFSIRPTYGAGASFSGRGTIENPEADWESSDESNGWSASSTSC
jgi:hypothetical protein